MPLSFGFSSSDSETETNETQTIRGNTTETENQTETQQTSGEQTSQSLSTEVLAAAESLILDMVSGGQASSVIGDQALETLAGGAQTAEQDILANIEPILEAARFEGEKSIQSTNQNAARAAGGSQANTLVQAATQEAQVDLTTQLAKLEAELGLQARSTQQQELLGVVQAATTDPNVNNITNLINSIKGGQSTTISNSESTANLARELEQIINQTITTVGTSETESGGFSFGF